MEFERVRANVIPFLFACVFGANILSMSLMNFFEAQTRYTTMIYIGCAVVPAILYIKARLNFPPLTGKEHFLCLTVGVILFVPRLPYLLEPVLGYSVNPLGDDFLHLQEMVAIARSPQFPPVSTFNGSRFLSYYYAPWMLGSSLYWTGVMPTIKQCLGLTVLIYSIFSSYSVLYAAKILFTERNAQVVFAAICVLYGGFDFVYWLSGLDYVPSHSQGWEENFGFFLEYSSYFTLALWVQQHLIATVGTFFALYAMYSSRSGNAGAALTGLILLSAIFSSVFVVFGAAPILAWFVIRHKLWRAVPVASAIFVTFALPLYWIFLGRTGAGGFKLYGALLQPWYENRRAAFLVFLVVISLQLMPLIAPAIRYARRQDIFIWPCLLSLLFLLSTFFFSFGLGQNYAMRGSIVPIFVLSYLAVYPLMEWSDHLRPRWLAIALASYLLGGLLEYTCFTIDAVGSLMRSNNALNAAILKYNIGSNVQALKVREVYAQTDRVFAWYMLERPGWSKESNLVFDVADAEIMNDDVGYRVTARRVAAWVSHIKSVWSGITSLPKETPDRVSRRL